MGDYTSINFLMDETNGIELITCIDKITEVALDTGFCDQSHFIKQFKKIVRLTPSKYILACNMLETPTD